MTPRSLLLVLLLHGAGCIPWNLPSIADDGRDADAPVDALGDADSDAVVDRDADAADGAPDTSSEDADVDADHDVDRGCPWPSVSDVVLGDHAIDWPRATLADDLTTVGGELLDTGSCRLIRSDDDVILGTPVDAGSGVTLCVFVVGDLHIGADLYLSGPNPVAFLAQGVVTLAGTMDLTAFAQIAGPGGGDGSERPDEPGEGSYGGSSGTSFGGGGGGGLLGPGGDGGCNAAGGGHGGAALSTCADLSLFVGGSGGGAGGPNGERGGGGGGGYLHIYSEASITVADGGGIEARGGDGVEAISECSGGGGGGSGGTIVLEAREVHLQENATIDVRGGNGGQGSPGTDFQYIGGAGAGQDGNPGLRGEDGASQDPCACTEGSELGGGGGGGGGAGRVLIRTCEGSSQPDASVITPTDAYCLR